LIRDDNSSRRLLFDSKESSAREREKIEGANLHKINFAKQHRIITTSTMRNNNKKSDGGGCCIMNWGPITMYDDDEARNYNNFSLSLSRSLLFCICVVVVQYDGTWHNIKWKLICGCSEALSLLMHQAIYLSLS
jgi:hypothetical protein